MLNCLNNKGLLLTIVVKRTMFSFNYAKRESIF